MRFAPFTPRDASGQCAHAEDIPDPADIVSAGTVHLSGRGRGHGPRRDSRCPREATRLLIAMRAPRRPTNWPCPRGRAEPGPVTNGSAATRIAEGTAWRSQRSRDPAPRWETAGGGARARGGRSEHRGRRHSRPRDADGLPHRADRGRSDGAAMPPIPHRAATRRERAPRKPPGCNRTPRRAIRAQATAEIVAERRRSR